MATDGFDWHGIWFEQWERQWSGPRGWAVSRYGNIFVASWEREGYATIVGVGKTAESSLDDCERQLRKTLALVADELRLRESHVSVIAEELARLT